MNPDILNRIIENIFSEVKIHVAWEGRYNDQNLKGEYQAYADTGNLLDYKKVRQSWVQRANLTHDEYGAMKPCFDQLSKRIRELSEEIYNRYCYNHSEEQYNAIPPDLYKRTVADIVQNEPEILVIVAPDKWLPL